MNMTSVNLNLLLALIGGALLALMIKLNSSLAALTTPLYASWLAHGIGASVALLLIAVITTVSKRDRPNIVKPLSRNTTSKHDRPTLSGGAAPKWSYLGGIPGAMVVILAAITVNSELGLSGTLVLGLLGQVLFGLLSDHFGLFGVDKKPISAHRLLSIIPIFSGASLIIFFGRS